MIEYLIGDASYPQGSGPRILTHISNDRGGWGAGFVLSISARWPDPEAAYRSLSSDERILGVVQFVEVEEDLYVANMIAQAGYGGGNRNLHRTDEEDSKPPIRYDALNICLLKVAAMASTIGASVHMPRIGCGLAGGKWALVEPIVARTLADFKVFVYDPNMMERAKH